MEVSPIDERFAMSQHLGKYRLVATLGQGGMGTVYLALATGVGQFRKLLVVKELLPDLTRKEGFIEMFLDEARLAARLDHPNVVQTFEAGNDAGRYFLAMEYLDGQPLSALLERLKDRGGLPLHIHLQILTEVLAGLHYAHELHDYDGSSLHVVHRDVSPQNVFITYHGQVKVVDFGVAKAANASALTHPGVFKGKFGYAAPEQIMGRPVDPRADVFAVGVMMWQAIAGKRFSATVPTPESFRTRATGGEPRIGQVVPDVDPLLADICDNALALDPDDRLRSAEEFYNDLVDYQILTRSRVEPAQIAQLMREVFADERQQVHRVIEQAMKHDGATESVVASLPFLKQEAEKVPTSRADLSSLIQVSHAKDDDEIRERYAQSMAAPLSSAPPPPLGFGQRAIAVARSPLALASLGFFGVLVVAWLGARLLTSAAEPSAPLATQARAPASAAAPPTSQDELPPPAAAEPSAAIAVQPLAPVAVQPPAPKIEEPVAAGARGRGEDGDEAKPRATRPREREGVLRVQPRSSGDGQGDPDMGSDLRSVRRGGKLRIDVEDPYL